MDLQTVTDKNSAHKLLDHIMISSSEIIQYSTWQMQTSSLCEYIFTEQNLARKA